jgi:hypothetical protein
MMASETMAGTRRRQRRVQNLALATSGRKAKQAEDPKTATRPARPKALVSDRWRPEGSKKVYMHFGIARFLEKLVQSSFFSTCRSKKLGIDL